MITTGSITYSNNVIASTLFTANSTVLDMYKDGVSIGTDTSPVWDGGTESTSEFFFGHRGGLANADIDVYSYVAINRVLNSNEKRNLQQWNAEQAGETLSSNNTYIANGFWFNMADNDRMFQRSLRSNIKHDLVDANNDAVGIILDQSRTLGLSLDDWISKEVNEGRNLYQAVDGNDWVYSGFGTVTNTAGVWRWGLN